MRSGGAGFEERAHQDASLAVVSVAPVLAANAPALEHRAGKQVEGNARAPRRRTAGGGVEPGLQNQMRSSLALSLGRCRCAQERRDEHSGQERVSAAKLGPNCGGIAQVGMIDAPLSVWEFMDYIEIEGGARLEGDITVSGAKNAALPLLACALLASGESTFTNLPDLVDVRTMGKLLAHIGCEVGGTEPGAAVPTGARTISIKPPSSDPKGAPYELVKTMRASVLVLGPLLARYGYARVSLPGGCAIGARPIDQHLKGLKLMGAEVVLEHGYVECKAKRLRGAMILLDMPTVTGCENLMMAAALADGVTVLENAAREPEIEDLAIMLNKMGARIQGAGTSVIRIEGVEKLHPIEHSIVPDRIEAGTFLVAGALTQGDLFVRGARADHLDAVLAKLRRAGATVDVESEGIRVRATARPLPLDITTQPHPGFPTDMQAQFMVLSCLADGQSVIKESIFENRFMHVSELSRMGASIQTDGRVAIVKGVEKLSGAEVMATDLRASASLVIAGLVAEGTTTVRRIYHLDRGYEHIESKLQNVGATITRKHGG